MMKIGRFLVIIVAFTCVLAILLVAASVMLNAPEAGIMDSSVYFSVRKGDTMGSVANRLADLEIIRSPHFFKLVSRIKGTDRQLKTGYYELPLQSSTTEIHDLLVCGRQVLLKVTIPEGATIRMIGEIMENAGICTAESFQTAAASQAILGSYDIPFTTAEGFLYPDTYYFQKDFPAEKVVSHMMEIFFENWATFTRVGEPMEMAMSDIVIIASIVEREYRVPEEADLIASVFYNRMEKRMPLQSCATVVFVMTELNGLDHPSRIYYEDLKIDSPYNTYLHRGLPPAPISNPGATALKAALYPADTDYLYFLLRDADQGQHYFSKNLTEHNRAHTLYIKGN